MRLIVLSFLLGGCFIGSDDPSPAEVHSLAYQMPSINALLIDDGVDAPHIAFSLCHGGGFFSCADSGYGDVLTVCDGAGCQTVDIPAPTGGASETTRVDVSLGVPSVSVTWSNALAQAGFTMPVPDDFAPTANQPTYGAGEKVMISWTPSTQPIDTAYSVDEECPSMFFTSGDIGLQAFGAPDPGQLVLTAASVGVAGETCADTIGIVHGSSAVLDAEIPDGRVDANTELVRSVNITVTE